MFWLKKYMCKSADGYRSMNIFTSIRLNLRIQEQVNIFNKRRPIHMNEKQKIHIYIYIYTYIYTMSMKETIDTMCIHIYIYIYTKVSICTCYIYIYMYVAVHENFYTQASSNLYTRHAPWHACIPQNHDRACCRGLACRRRWARISVKKHLP